MNQFGIDLTDKPTGVLERCSPPNAAYLRGEEIQLASSPSNCYVENPALLLDILIAFILPAGEELLLQTGNKNAIKLQPLGVVHRDQGNAFLIPGIIRS